MGVPVQVPWSAASVLPSRAVPVIVGGVLSAGATAAIAPLAADAAEALPAAFVAVTSTRTVAPTSAAVRSRVCAVEPAMSEQFAPPASQRCHW